MGNNVIMNATTFVPYNQTSLFYEPIPFEFLYTNETSPQVVVNIEGIEAVCDSLNCNYNYIQPTAQITSFSLSSDGSLLTISGTGFTRPLRKITFATFPCTSPSIVNDQTITCQTQKVVGNWQPEVIDEYGIVPVATEDTIHISLEISSINPSLDLNPYGGTDLTILGSNFPPSLNDDTTVSVSFEDGTLCNVLRVSSTTIECITEKFNTTTDSSLTVTVQLNGEVD